MMFVQKVMWWRVLWMYQKMCHYQLQFAEKEMFCFLGCFEYVVGEKLELEEKVGLKKDLEKGLEKGLEMKVG
eukprot:CAMPEP_0201562146 /NCGR_PEP_ID=MMETSP0173_2-20130828/79170_1 /ASSEMBLY_ACC=CAM_ASM_000268 /TAXON_ID=218659 /ORGANISM="Vexillifera sp., Strain DIVA3 564/2" /LENGTH=71 /DNA_ID=CAMNT_0047976687 /DNA_START=793 /DNA_END=1004 /DNA_ORIENTATION=+